MMPGAVIFDLDGTLTEPYLDFDAMRAKLGVTGPVLEAMAHMDAAARQQAEAALVQFEQEAAQNVVLREGALEVIEGCKALGYPVAILTRNARSVVRFILETLRIRVDAVRTREDGAIKPSPEPVLDLCRELNADARHSWVVGDYLFDVMSGRAAGTHTVLMIGDKPVPDYADEADFVIRRLKELLPIVGGAANTV